MDEPPAHVRRCRDCGGEFRPEIVLCKDCGGMLEDAYLDPDGSVIPSPFESATLSRPAPEEPKGPFVILLNADVSEIAPLATRLGEAGIPFRVAPGLSSISVPLDREAEARSAAQGLVPESATPEAGEGSGPSRCPACGSALHEGARECPECHLSLGAREEIVCPSCETVGTEGWACPWCGRDPAKAMD